MGDRIPQNWQKQQPAFTIGTPSSVCHVSLRPTNVAGRKRKRQRPCRPLP
jgi:hypothetical protein